MHFFNPSTTFSLLLLFSDENLCVCEVSVDRKMRYFRHAKHFESFFFPTKQEVENVEHQQRQHLGKGRKK